MNKKYDFLRPHINKGRFYNYKGEGYRWILLSSIVMYLISLLKRILSKDLYKKSLFRSDIPFKKSFVPTITWIGHSTFLIQFLNKNILVDPIFGNMSFLFKRILPPGITLKNLPKIDYVLISHNHSDHMELKSLIYIRDKNPDMVMLVPEGNYDFLKKYGFKNIVERRWWENFNVQVDSFKIIFTFLPAVHWSFGGIFNRNKSLWGSWMLECDNFYTIYFAGDTAYSDHFKVISEKFKNIDLALLPIGPCNIRRWVKNSHLNSEESLKAFIDLKAKEFIPMQWGTFYMGTDSLYEPLGILNFHWNKNLNKLKNLNLRTLKFGQRVEIHSPRFMREDSKSLINRP
jgi:L-ascorbate metabolism protein UlaG (beta-lactamase superfamily)